MNRRELLLVAAGTALACNSAVGQVQIPRIGFILTGSRPWRHAEPFLRSMTGVNSPRPAA